MMSTRLVLHRIRLRNQIYYKHFSPQIEIIQTGRLVVTTKNRNNMNNYHQVSFFSSSTLEQKQTKSETTPPSSSSTGFVSSIFPSPQPDPIERRKADEIENQNKKRRTIREGLALGWRDYKLTWEGFFDNLKEKKDKDSTTTTSTRISDGVESILQNIDEEKIIQGQKDIQKNVKRNIKVIKNEGAEVIEAVKDFTGITTKEELTRWVMVQLKLANECVAEFMKGYRTTRDEEIDKMMNEYFKDFDEEETKGHNGNGKNRMMIENQEDANESSSKSQMKAGRQKRRRKSKW